MKLLRYILLGSIFFTISAAIVLAILLAVLAHLGPFGLIMVVGAGVGAAFYYVDHYNS
jgi:hypothetical protein